MGETVITAAKTPARKPEKRASQKKTEVSQVSDSPAEQILFLQRTSGNKAVERLIKSRALQAKLKIGQPWDKYEQEADRIAEQVMRMPDPQVSKETKVSRLTPGTPIQRRYPGCIDKTKKEEDEEVLRAKEVSCSTPEVTPELESSINAICGGGQPLPEATRAFFEPRFGQDFSQVKVHMDANAAGAARAVNARAFTVERDVVFGEKEYVPEVSKGSKLLAHELTHVIQQQKGYSLSNNSIGHSQVQLQEKTETSADKIIRIIADEDDNAIVALNKDELSATSASQRAGMIRILTDLTWTGESEESATLRLLEFRGEHEKVIHDLDSLGYRQKVIDSIDNADLNKELLGLLSGGQVKKGGDDATAKALASKKSADVMAIKDFTHATNEQRLGLLQIMLDMYSSDEVEEGKILDILESAGMGGNLKSLIDLMKALGLKQSLFDHVDAKANKERLTKRLTFLKDPEIDKDLKVFNRDFIGNAIEGISGGFSSALKDFDLGKIFMGFLNPIFHPIETIISLIEQFLKFLQKPSWDRFLTFARDMTGFIAQWLFILFGITAGIALLVGSTVVLIPGSVAIGVIAASLLADSILFGGAFLIFAGLKFLVDLAQAGSATTARELEREQKEIGEDMTLGAIILLFAGILKGIKFAVARFKGSAVNPKAAEPDALKETAKETKNSSDQAGDAIKEMQDKGNEANKEPPNAETKAPKIETPKMDLKINGNEGSAIDPTTGELLGLGTLDAQGYIEYAIYTKGLKSTIRGGQVFDAIYDEFNAQGKSIKGIRGLWYGGDNLKSFNEAIIKGVSPEGAAHLNTFTGTMAGRKGFSNVRIDYEHSPRNPDGTFQRAELWFEPEPRVIEPPKNAPPEVTSPKGEPEIAPTASKPEATPHKAADKPASAPDMPKREPPKPDDTVWVQLKDGSIREYKPSEVDGNIVRGAKVQTPDGTGKVVSRAEPPNANEVEHPTRPSAEPLKAKWEESKKRFENFRRKVEPENIKGAQPAEGSGTAGHAKSKHGFSKEAQAEILNTPEKVFSGKYEKTGREVDIYYKNGDVVITEAGKKDSVITAYGKSNKGGGTAVNPDKWANDPAYVEVKTEGPNQVIYPNRERWEKADWP